MLYNISSNIYDWLSFVELPVCTIRFPHFDHIIIRLPIAYAGNMYTLRCKHLLCADSNWISHNVIPSWQCLSKNMSPAGVVASMHTLRTHLMQQSASHPTTSCNATRPIWIIHMHTHSRVTVSAPPIYHKSRAPSNARVRHIRSVWTHPITDDRDAELGAAFA